MQTGETPIAWLPHGTRDGNGGRAAHPHPPVGGTPVARARLSIAMMAVLLVFGVAACGDDGDARSGIEFGRGTLPETVPEDFPIPDVAVINSTLIDWDRNRTEVNMVFPAELSEVARYFDENLANRGYLVQSSTGSESAWSLDFSKERLQGDIALAAQTSNATVVTVEFIDE